MRAVSNEAAIGETKPPTERARNLLSRTLVQQEPPGGLKDEIALERGKSLVNRREREVVAGTEGRARCRVRRVQFQQSRDGRVARVREVVAFQIGSQLPLSAGAKEAGKRENIFRAAIRTSYVRFSDASVNRVPSSSFDPVRCDERSPGIHFPLARPLTNHERHVGDAALQHQLLRVVAQKHPIGMGHERGV